MTNKMSTASSSKLKRTQFLATRIVDCLGIGKDARLVVISGWRHSIELADEISSELARRGIDMMNISVSEGTFFAQLDHMSVSLAKETWRNRARLVQIADAGIYLPGPRDPSKYNKRALKGVEKLFHGETALFATHRRLRKPGLFLGAGWVTPERASTYGFPFEKWKTCIEDSTLESGPLMSSKASGLRRLLDDTKIVHLSSSHGTDLRFALSEKPSIISDGRITKEDIRTRSVLDRLPSGMVTKLPSEGIVEGTVFFDSPIHILGRILNRVRFTFNRGRLRSVWDDEGFLGRLWNRATGDKDRLGKISIGINRAARLGYDIDNLVNGAVTLRVGDNLDLGGTNRSNFSLEGTLRECSLRLDEKRVDLMEKLKS